MHAIILAAGMGKRLKDLTKNNTKCMVKVNGISLIDRLLHQLDGYGLEKIVVVVGYEREKLMEFISTLDINTQVEYVENPIYDKTNNIYSLALAKSYLLEDDTLLFESDLIFEKAVIDSIFYDERDTLALVDKYESWMDGTCVKLSADDKIEAFIPGKSLDFNESKDYYKTVNIYKFSKNFSRNYYVPFLDAYTKALGENEYYEQVLRVITMLDEPGIKAKRLNGEKWYEIDDIQDLDIAESLFESDSEKQVSLVQSRYGGYWRYPKMIDFCYLVNPYFPPKRLIDEMKASFDRVITEYPSGIRVNSLLAAKNFGVREENIIVGNGAAELIKVLMDSLEGKVGFIRPTFEEYPNRYNEEKRVVFVPENEDFSYDEKDIKSFFEDKDISSLIVINPDNPTGNYIGKSGLLELVAWAEKKHIKLIIDESFADFADEEDNSLIDQELLENNKDLYVVKSISKSHGVPGIRLGVLASGDTDFISHLKKNVSIWNINSFGEFYMQIFEKYKKEYFKALEMLKKERKFLEEELGKNGKIRVIPSQANYVMVELSGDKTAKEVTAYLFKKHNLLVKDLSAKIKGKQFLRLAVRNREDNEKLLEALKNI